MRRARIHKFLDCKDDDRMSVEAPDNSILQEDIERIALHLTRFPEIKNKSFFVTGATGLLGSLIVKSLMCLNRCHQFNVTVFALVRNLDKAKSTFGKLVDYENLRTVVGDVLHIPEVPESIDYILHGASATSSQYFVEHPVETIDTAINGTKNVLDLAKTKKIASMLYLSSLEVYGTLHSEEPVGEDFAGYIDPLSIRSSYSESKRMAENLCCAFSSQYGVPVKIARLAQTFGAGASYDDNRVFAQFARSVIEQTNIVLHTEGSTTRNYCHTSDAVRALFTILLRGTDRSAYNVANMDTSISIRDMAKMVSSFGSDTEVVFHLEDNKKFGYNPTVKICLDTSRLNQLGWAAEVGLTEMFQTLIKSMEIDKACKSRS